MQSEDQHFAKIEKLQFQKQALQKENRFLKAKLKETQASRQVWKNKFKALGESKPLAKDEFLWQGIKAKHHSYSVLLFVFCGNMQAYGAMSLRACVHVLFCLQLAFGSPKKLPSYSSIRVWVCKLGKYRIESEGISEEKWLYWIDESIHIGNEKILLVLGLPEKKLDFQRALSLPQMRVLYMEVATQWTGEQIAEVLQNLQAKFPLAYVVSDSGNNLKKSYRLANTLHIGDCTHVLSKGIEKCYKGHLLFEPFCKWAGELRKKWSLHSANKSYLPPSQRNKVRFANLFPLVKWAKKQLAQWDTLPEEIQEAFSFLCLHKEWVLDFWSIQEQLVKISLILKIEGYSLANRQRIEAILGGGQSKEHEIFSIVVKEYLADLAQKLGNREQLYCCSDVIESAFGKLKQKLPKNSPALSSFILTLASIGGQYQSSEVRKALETIKGKDLKKPPKKEKNSPIFDGKNR